MKLARKNITFAFLFRYDTKINLLIFKIFYYDELFLFFIYGQKADFFPVL
ncbi:Uncharacterized protein dnm_024050 [Desulfonema magnum]|uniref:Uncharacterized protein n=1 Tax=Desulfonema magnum TaxID=45655 RepID=A0A975GLZ9_9BACT|nr:Uncharacterized protein dnm_024050 [Desulfonema magnum]